MKRLARAAYVAVLAVAIIAAVGMAFRARRFANRHAEAISQVIRLEAEKSGIIAEAKRVASIEAPEAASGVIRAGARVASKVEARIETHSESVGPATVTEGTIGAADEHKRFLVTIPYVCTRECEIDTGEARWAITQRFQLETVEFQQTGMENGVAFKGFSVAITERSPMDDSVLARYQSKRDDITAIYTISKRRGKWFVPFANVGLGYGREGARPYGIVGVRVKRIGIWVGAFGSEPAAGIGWAFGG